MRYSLGHKKTKCQKYTMNNNYDILSQFWLLSHDIKSHTVIMIYDMNITCISYIWLKN